MAERLLIVNADDYGLTEGVSRAILRAADDGIVTSTSVLAVAPGFAASAPWLVDSGVAAGAHLAVVGEDPPVLSASEIPTLVNRQGSFCSSWRQFVPRVAARRVDPDDLRREFGAQLARLRAAGLSLTHVDTHQHVHLWPPVGRVLLEVAAGADITAVRIIRSSVRTPVGRSVQSLARRFERRAVSAGFRFPATATGLDEAGALDRRRLVAAVERMAATGAASAELAVHPGEADDPDLVRYRWGYRWSDELAALCDPAVRAAVDRAGFRLGTYADLYGP